MIERWTPKIKQEQCTEGMTLRMWTDKDGEYVLYTDHLKHANEQFNAGYRAGAESHHERI